MADYNVNMKQWNGTSFDNVLPLAYNAKQLGGQSLAEVKQWVQDNELLLYTGQYIGTGDYGISNPTSVTFPFEPILFFFPTGFRTININELTQDYKGITTYTSQYGNYHIYVKKSNDGKTICWYSEDNVSSQSNEAAVFYNFAAIGGYDMGGQTEWMITSSGSWTVPKTGRYMLELYGGGGGAVQNTGYQGGSSCQVYDSVTLTEGTSIQVMVGSGERGADGGSTSFGSYSVSGGGVSSGKRGGKGAGNKGTDGVNATYDTKNVSAGIFGSQYGWGKNSGAKGEQKSGGPGAVYLKYLGA